MQLKSGDPKSLAIMPPPREEDYDKDSVDLRLGKHFFVPKGHRAAFFCPGYTSPEELYQEEYIQLGNFLLLPAHSTVLGATLEFIKIPCDMAGQILTKSSWARTFITIETAPWVHPLYRGCLTLEIANASNTPIVLYPGVKIAQLVLMQVQEYDCTDDIMTGTYIGPVRPEPASIKGPEHFLTKELGVSSSDIQWPFPRDHGK